MNDSLSTCNTYRDFRAYIINNICAKSTEHDNHSYYGSIEVVHPIKKRKSLINKFRNHVLWNLQSILEANPSHETFIRRTLKIPNNFSLKRTILTRLVEIPFAFFDQIAIARARRILERVKTFQGRKYIFDKHISWSMPGFTHYFTESEDYAIRYIRPGAKAGSLRRVARLERGLLRIFRFLGLSTAEQIIKQVPEQIFKFDEKMLQVLLDEDVIQHSSELYWIEYQSSFNWQQHRDLKWQDLQLAKDTIRCLQSFSIRRELTAKIFLHSLHSFDPQQLFSNLSLLKSRHIDDISGIFQEAQEILWQTPDEFWRIAIDIIEARTPATIKLFKKALRASKPISTELILALKEFGAGIEDIEVCQDLLISLARGRRDDPPVEEIKLLLSPPHSLSFEEIAQCQTYLEQRGNLSAHLNAINLYGYDDSKSILAFQACYGIVAPLELTQLLALTNEINNKDDAKLVADWVAKAGRHHSIDVLQYLAATIDLPTISSFEQILKLVPLGQSFLKWLIEEKKLSTIKMLKDWYYNDAQGIDRYSNWGTFDAARLALIEDAFSRKRFHQLAGNEQCLSRAVSNRARATVGGYPVKADREEREIYLQKIDKEEKRIREEIAPSLGFILRQTDGILLQSLIQHEWHSNNELEERLGQLKPLMDNLLSGQSPSSPTLSEMEADAIALVYRTEPQTIKQHWQNIINETFIIGDHTSNKVYPIYWRQAQWKIHGSLDRKGMLHLLKAAQFALRFEPQTFKDMFTACQHLSPKQYSEPSADINSLALHLGVLLAAAMTSESVAEWIKKGFSDLYKTDEDSVKAYQYINDLVAFFDIGLTDALDAQADKFIKRFGDSDVLYLISRLGNFKHAAVSEAISPSNLKSALYNIKSKVLPIYLKWAKRERKKFESSQSDDQSMTELQAVVSKSPASFFAKRAVGLCTSENISMWKEVRHAHVLVFDSKGRRLAGMAMLFVEVIPQLHRTQASLIIRGINPTEEMLATHTSESIADSLLDVAINIAEQSDLACVAFTPQTGMHLLSNADSIAAALTSRYIKAAERHMPQSESDRNNASLKLAPERVATNFYAYEGGSNSVDILYVIWRNRGLFQPNPLMERL